MNVLLLDTETFSGSEVFSMYDNYVFDFGAVVIENVKEYEEYPKNVPIYSYNKLIKEIYRDEKLIPNYVFGQEKFKRFYLDGSLKDIPFEEFVEDLKKLIETYNISAIAAYNIRFDLNALKTTAKKFKVDISFLDKLEIIDLYHMACQALQGNESYQMFCYETGRVSEKGNINSNAEAVYSFISGNNSFEEDHTALSDCLIEFQIYKWLLSLEKERQSKFSREPYSACWRLVQPKKGKN